MKRLFISIFMAIFCVFVGAYSALAACTNDQIDVAGDGSDCQDVKFTLTTTSAVTTQFQFRMTAKGTFYVDCGADGSLSGTGASGKTISRSNTDTVTYTCTYSTGGAKTLKFGGRATGYHTGTGDSDAPGRSTISFRVTTGKNTADTNAPLVASITGKLGSIFPTLGTGNGQQPQFYGTFKQAANLTSIPADFFDEVYGSRDSMFRETFDSTGITEIPYGLFKDASGGADHMFRSTFNNCTSLTSIPEDLFAGITSAGQKMFSYTFNNCSGLTGKYIPASAFKGLVAAGHPTATNMWASTFAGTNALVTSCPSNTNQFTTGYESLWNSRKSCILKAIPITLDMSDATTPGAPTTVYLKYNDGWYSDSALTTPITQMTTLPQKSGHSFAGYYYENTQIVDMDGYFNTDTDALKFTTYAKTLSAQFGAAANTVTYDCGTGTGTPPANGSAIPGVPFSPADAGGCTKTGYAFSGWAVSGTNDVVSTSFTWEYDSDKTFTAQWSEAKFSVTTSNLGDGATFQFKMTAIGTFYVNCGINGVLTSTANDVSGNGQITRTGTGETTYTCTYSTGGVKTISFGGTATGYSTADATFTNSAPNLKAAAIQFTSGALITAIDGNLPSLFPYISGNAPDGAQPRFRETFNNAQITSIPATLFNGYTTGVDGMFAQTFSGCTQLTNAGLPATLFGTITTGASSMFYSTFKGATSLTTIPSGLFTNISKTTNTNNSSMFKSTFEGCTHLTTIPSNLFDGIAYGSGNMFNATFKGCTALTTIPSGLFSNVTTGAESMFIDTFYGCNHLTTIPSGLFGSITTGAKNMFQRTFQGCTALTTIPSGMFSGITSGAGGMFLDTFKNDTSLVNLPDDLFGSIRISETDLFRSTFDGCTSLSGYIKPSWFAGLLANGAPIGVNMWKNTFNSTQMATSCPANTTQYFTGYDGNDTVIYSRWNGYVACVPTTPMEISLNATGATSAATPSTVYLSYDNGWYSDANGTTSVSQLTAVPTKTGLVFAGFYTGPDGTGIQVIDASGQFVTNTVPYDTTTLYAYFGSATYTVTYACGDGATGTAPAAMGAADGAMFVPADAGGCAKSGYVFSGWAVSGTNDIKQSPFTWNYNGNKTFTAVWYDSGFSITTTNLSDGGVFKFQISAVGTFTVDCGENGVLSGSGTGSTISGNTITRTAATNFGTYTCTYSTGGVKTINFGGNAILYSASDAAIRFKNSTNLTETKIASVTGNMSAVFPYITSNAQNGAQPRFRETFKNATNLTTIDGNLFSGYTTGATNMFQNTFQGCTTLTTIPSNLFKNITNGASYMFSYTFQGCTALTTIPDGLFENITNGASYMFEYVFQGCTSLSAMPERLFAGLTTGGDHMFNYAFAADTSMTGYIPPSTFAGLVETGAAIGTNTWSTIFYNGNTLAKSCPEGTTQYFTGYEGGDYSTTWYGKVSCISDGPMTIALDTTGATTSGSPSTVYLVYNTGWYSDSNATTDIARLTTLPTKTGQSFVGFYTKPNGEGDLIISGQGYFVSNRVLYDATTLYAHFGTGYDVTYSCGTGATGTAPAADKAIVGQSFITPNKNTCAKDGYIFAGWDVSGTNDVKLTGESFTWEYESDKTFTAQWEPVKFSIGTTNLNANDVFKFKMSASGTFYVDCGDGGVLTSSANPSDITNGNIITRNNNDEKMYTCTYSTGGAKTINFGGTATGYRTGTGAGDSAIRFKDSTNLTETKIASVTGNMSAVFPYITSNAQDGAQPRFKNTFQGATNLTTIDVNLFSGYTTGATSMFSGTFQGCTALTTIPDGLFENIITGATSMFSGTFQGCTALTTIPDGLFENIITGATSMFENTFRNCGALTAIPERLFAGITNAADRMFFQTFRNCPSLTGYISPSMFAGLIANGSPTASTMFGNGRSDENTWGYQDNNNHSFATACPSGTTQYFTGYESSWIGKKSCISDSPMTIALDTTGATTSGSPSTVYLVYNTGWYSDSNATTDIARLTSLPTKTGQSFVGFYTKPNGAGDLIINGQGYFVSNRVLYDATTLYAHFGTGYDVTYSCGNGATGTAPAADKAIVGQSFITPNKNTCAKDGYIFAGWDVSGTNDVKLTGESFTWEYESDKTFTAQWEPVKFSIGTTNLNANDVFKFQMNAIGEFYVDCGEGGTLTSDVNPTDVAANVKITRTSTAKQDTYTCTYATAGTKTIRFGGVATAYNTSTTTPSIRFRNGSNLTETEIASVTGNMSAMFPYITENAQDGAQPRFYQTFYGATNLTSIGGNLFSGYTTGATSMFQGTFYNCSSLTTIPDGLFENVTTGATSMFYGTFQYCTSLTAMPERLFAGVTNAVNSMFNSAFFGDTSMTGYIPPSTFAGLIANGSPGANSEMWYRIFVNNSLLDTCPSGTTQYFTGYEGFSLEKGWTTKKSCISDSPMTIALDTTGATTAGSPSTVYLKYNTGWYTDSNATTGITRLTTLPTKTGQTFVGFYTGENGTGKQAVNAQGYFVNNTNVFYDTTTLYAHFGTGYTVTYSCGNGATGTAPAADNAVVSQSFTPANQGTCEKPGYTFTGWAVSGTNDVKTAGNSFTWEYEANKTFTAQWFDSKFVVNTTNIAANGTFTFKMSAIGTFNVSCGDDGVLSSSANDVSGTTITRTDTTQATYTCTYPTAGTHIVAFNGVATGYSTGLNESDAAISFKDNKAVSSVIGSLGTAFPTLGSGSGQQPIFRATFEGCSNLTTIPANLFSGVTGGAVNMFRATFSSCSSLAAIPNGLFDDITESAQELFRATFSDCSSLTTIPANLFANITSGATYLFYNTFYGCSSLSGYISPTLFAGLIANGSPEVGWYDVWYNTKLATSCPAGMHQYITKYESGWRGKVSCVCDGARYFDNYTCLACPTGYNSTVDPDKISINKCQIDCAGGTYLATANSTSCSNVGAGYYTLTNTTYYGDTGTRNECPAGTYSAVTNATSCTACPIGTYSSTTGGASVSSCSACTGATYGNETGLTACKPCPTGYDYNTTSGKTSMNQCQIHCDAGTYAGSLVPDGYTELEYVQTTGTQYINTGVAMNTLVNPTMSLTMQYDSTGTYQQNGLGFNHIQFKVGISSNASNFQCQADGDGTDVIFGPADTNKHTFVLDTANATCSLDNNTLPITVADLSTMSSTAYFQIGARDGSAKNNAKYYHFSITSNGILIRDMVPAKRDSDDAVGMYDLVNGVFYPNAGTGDIVAGRAVGGSGCRNVGTGYWATASTLNFGTLGTRTACPVGTYSPIETGASAAACLSCPGATYGDETAAAACKSCPVNYDYNTTSGKTAENQCQTHCDAGTYVSTVIPDAYTQLEYIESTGTQYIYTGVKVSDMVTPIMTLDMQYTTVANWKGGAGQSHAWGNFYVQINGQGKFEASASGDLDNTTASKAVPTKLGDADTNRHTFVVDTQHSTASIDSITLPLLVNSIGANSGQHPHIMIGGINQGSSNTVSNMGSAKFYRFNLISDGVEIRNMIPVRRNLDNVAGMYDTINNVFYQSASEDAFIAGPATACVAAGYGHYSAAATVDYGSTNANTLGACPVGKYSDVLNGTSVSVCQSCSGATYANTTGMGHCNACPFGYDYNTTSGKTAANQCQIHCDAGTYLMNPGNLPSGYTQLPYIESTGNQYIETNLKLSNLTNPVMSLTMQYTQVQASRQSGFCSDTVCFRAGINSDTKFSCQADETGTQTVFDDADTNIHTFVVNTANATCSLDGVSSPLTIGTLNVKKSIKVLADASQSKSKAKLYSFSLISNGVEIMNLVPAKRDADGAIGMYDTIGNAFYPNVGTGTFVAPQTGCTGVESGYYAAASTANYGATYVDTHNACPAGYDYSAAGVAGAQTDCYAMCSATDVPHATATTGGKYYGGNTTCEPLDSNSCDTNYRYVAASGNNLAQCLADLININWGDANGGVWATTQCEYGGTITTPTTAPTKRGHTFVGWRFVAPEQSPVEPGE